MKLRPLHFQSLPAIFHNTSALMILTTLTIWFNLKVVSYHINPIWFFVLMLPTALSMSAVPFTTANPAITRLIKQMSNPIVQRAYLIARLPSVWFMRARIERLSPKEAVVRLPFSWRSQNPFRSTYFGAQAAAAELSTGILVALLIQGQGKISMLVTHMEADFHKKATHTLRFTCDEADAIIQAIQQAQKTGEGQTLTLHSKGIQTLPDGTQEVASTFSFEWSIKVKS